MGSHPDRPAGGDPVLQPVPACQQHPVARHNHPPLRFSTCRPPPAQAAGATARADPTTQPQGPRPRAPGDSGSPERRSPTLAELTAARPGTVTPHPHSRRV